MYETRDPINSKLDIRSSWLRGPIIAGRKGDITGALPPELGLGRPNPRRRKDEMDELESRTDATPKHRHPRCYKPEGFGRIVRKELHHFSDASVKGYGQCSYLRLIDEHQKIHCTFVMGKSRVAPLKPVTIPRLELTAAVCSARVSQQIRRELQKYHVDIEYYWTDSKVVLGYISNESRRFHVFVSNRVQEIQDSTDVTQWRYVESKENPADEASRGVKARELGESRWIRGPNFLWDEESKWPNGDLENVSLPQDDPEMKKSVVTTTATSEVSFPDLDKRIESFSDWCRAKRAVALCRKYVRKLKTRINGGGVQEPTEINVVDLEAAGKLIVQAIQVRAFSEEMTTLKGNEGRENQRDLKLSSKIAKLNPFLDDDGILRVGGRLKNADLPYGVKYPMILPRSSHVSSLIIRHFHERTAHQGKGMTFNEVRSNGFWVVGGSSEVSSAIHQCVKCRRLRGAVVEQKMSDLPQERLERCPLFTYCTVDYLGPSVLTEGRKSSTRYGVLFTCMASRAVHLET